MFFVEGKEVEGDEEGEGRRRSRVEEEGGC